MAKPTIVTRAGKGSALTWTEGDTNLTNLRDATVTIKAGTGGTDVVSDLNGTVTLVAGTNVTISGDNTAKTVTINASGTGGGLTDIVQDTTPQLGGDLDVNGNSIVSASNGNIAITPNGTGSVVIDGNAMPQDQGTADQVLITDGAGQTSWSEVKTVYSLVYNAEATTISKGQPVYLFSATGANPSVKLALNTSDATSAKTYGLAAENITAGSTGRVVIQGVLKNIDTGSYSAGATLYLGSTAGSMTTTKPYAPNHLVYLGVVTTVNSTSGRIIVRVQNGYELDEIHDVNINHNVTLNNGDILTYNSSNSLWENRPPASLALDGLSDVVITAAATGDLLRYNGTNWVDVAESSITVGTASVGSTVTLTADNTTNATNYPLFANAATGNLSPRTDTGFTYNPSTGVLTATTFSGALSGNATTATTATNATNINISATSSTDTTCSVVLVANQATGNQSPFIDSLAYNASNGTLTATGFSGPINGSIGATTPSTGAFTTISASGQVTANGNLTANSTVTGSPKLTIGTGALSSTAWTTNGIGLRIQTATYTDTSSLAGTVAASHVHAITAPTMASTNAITVTDAGTLYISGAPTPGTNTSITNAWALLANGRIKATAVDNTPIGSTTASTGAFTTLSASSTVSGTGFSNYLASPPAIGGTAANTITGTTITANTGFAGALNGTVGATTPNTGAFTTLSASTTSTSGALNITFNPATASGSAINTSGKDSQGGTGYFDFLKITNTTSGATNANKTFRTNSTGQLEIVNSAYNAVILALTDAGALQVGGTTFPTTSGTNGQVLTVNGSGVASWTTPSGSGTVTSVSGTGTVSGLSLSGTVTSSGSLTLGGTLDLSSPPAIGGTAANTITGTTVTASTQFSGPGTGLTGTASSLTAGNATNVGLTNDASTTTNYIAFSNTATGNQPLKTHTGIKYNASTGVITAWGLETTGTLKRSGNWSSSAWTTQGAAWQSLAATFTDTSSTGTVATSAVHALGAPTLASTNTITVTDAANLYVATPVAGTNTTITNPWSIVTTGGVKVGTRLQIKDLVETVYTGGATTGTITPDVANGTVQKITLTGSITFNAFANPVAGQSLTLIITQSASGGLTLTSTMKFSGGSKTLSTAANAIDILTVFYDGSTYYASLAKGFA